METKEIRRIFYRDGYRLAHEHLDQGLNTLNLRCAIAQLYQAVDDLLASFLERSATDGEPSECKKGCAWCCYQEVFAVTHEFLYIHEYVQGNFSQEVKDSILKRARDKGKLSLNKSLEEQKKLRFACPFLEGDSCLVYKARPMACRVYLSSSVRSCKREYDQPGNQTNIPELYEFPLLAGRMLNEGFVAYLKQSGLLSSELPIELGYSSLISFGMTLEEWVEGKPGSS